MKTEEKVREIKNAAELKECLRPLYVIENYTDSDERYKNFQEEIYTMIKGCFEKKECREYPVKFKFYKNDTEIHTLQFRYFVVNVFLWYPFINLHGIDGVLDESFILSKSEEVPKITNYINQKIIKTLRDYTIKNTIVNRNISEVTHNLGRISVDFSLIMGLSITAESFLFAYRDNPELQEIMNSKFSMDSQPYEIEQQLNELQTREIELFKSLPDNPIGVILRANKGIKHKQLSEFTISMGLKPDLNGVTIPLPISTSTLIGGLNKPSYHYIDALGARKSLIMNKKVMGRAGYFGKVVLLLSLTLQLSKTVSDCNTKHYVDITITNKRMLFKYLGRYYKDEETGETKMIDPNKDTHLIGKTIKLRSPITCACGDEVCHKCFGFTSTLNFDISEGVTGYESEEVSRLLWTL